MKPKHETYLERVYNLFFYYDIITFDYFLL